MPQLTEEQQTVAIAAIASTLGKSVAEIETILTGDAPTEVDTLVSARIKAVKKEGRDGGKGELQQKANAKAKELFGTDTAELDTIDKLMDAIKTGYTPPVDPSKLTEEQIKTSAAYRTLESTLTTERENHQKAIDKAIGEAKAEVDREKLSAKAIQALADYGAVISDDSKIAAVQKEMYLRQLQGVTTTDVDGKPEFWKADADGNKKRIETDKLIPVAEGDFFKGLVESIYTTRVSDQTNSSGVKDGQGEKKQQNGGSFTHFKGTPPKNLEEYNNIIRDRTNNTFEARQEVTKYWQDQQQK